MSKVYSVKLEHDGYDLILPLPDELLAETGWKTNDTLSFNVDENGHIIISKVESVETEYVMVETVQTFHHRYVVEVPKGKSEWALDTVTCEEAKEFSQKPLGEQIVSHRVVSKEEVLAISDADNDYALYWPEEQKLKTFITPWDNSK